MDSRNARYIEKLGVIHILLNPYIGYKSSPYLQFVSTSAMIEGGMHAH